MSSTKKTKDIGNKCQTCSSCVKCTVVGLVLLLVGAFGGYMIYKWCVTSQIQNKKDSAVLFLNNIKDSNKENFETYFTKDAKILLGHKEIDIKTFMSPEQPDGNTNIDSLLELTSSLNYDESSMVAEDDTVCVNIDTVHTVRGMFNNSKFKSTSVICMKIKSDKVSELLLGGGELLED